MNVIFIAVMSLFIGLLYYTQVPIEGELKNLYFDPINQGLIPQINYNKNDDVLFFIYVTFLKKSFNTTFDMLLFMRFFSYMIILIYMNKLISYLQMKYKYNYFYSFILLFLFAFHYSFNLLHSDEFRNLFGFVFYMGFIYEMAIYENKIFTVNQLILSIAAMAMHKSFILLIPFLWFIKWYIYANKIDIKKIIKYGPIVAIIGYGLINMLVGFTGIFSLDKVNHNTVLTGAAWLSKSGNIASLLIFGFYLFLAYRRNAWISNDKFFLFMVTVSIFSIYAQLLGLVGIQFVEPSRIMFSFLPFFILSFLMLLKMNLTEQSFSIFVILLVLYEIVTFYTAGNIDFLSLIMSIDMINVIENFFINTHFGILVVIFLVYIYFLKYRLINLIIFPILSLFLLCTDWSWSFLFISFGLFIFHKRRTNINDLIVANSYFLVIHGLVFFITYKTIESKDIWFIYHEEFPILILLIGLIYMVNITRSIDYYRKKGFGYD